MSDIVMPRLSDSMEEGTVVRWLKGAGEHVARGEPLVEIETDKATITYESDLEGVLTLILVREGETVPVGQQIAMIEAVGAPGQEQPQQPQQPPAQAAPPPLPVPPAPEPQVGPGEYDVFEDSGVTAEHPPVQQQVGEEFPIDDSFSQPPPVQQEQPPFFDADTGSFTPAGQWGEGTTEQTGEHAAAGRVKASPVARRLARKLGVDVAAVQGTGPGGRVVKEDVERAADAAAAASQSQPTQAPAPEYAYEPGGSERHEDDMFSLESPEPQPLPLPPDEIQITPPATQQPEPPAPSQQPAAPPPQPGPPPQPQAPAPQPSPGVPPQPAFPQPSFTPPPPQPQQPFPGPPPFVQGMTGNFGAIPPQPQQPQAPPQQPAQQPPPQQPPPQQPQPQAPAQEQQAQGAETATRGQSTPVEPTTAQRTVARRMAESKATAPEFFVETEVDMTMAVNFREQLRSAVSPVPSFNDFVIKAAAQALRQYPKVNAAYKDGHFEQYSDVNIGVVVSATELLAVPTLFNVDQKGLAQIARESHDLSEAVRNRTIQPAQLSGGTFSISNLGMYGVERFTAILNPPQAAILAVGAINRRAVIAEDGMSLVIRQIMNMTLTCDHRILYGAEAAEFLGAIKAWLENPQMLQV